MHCLSLWNLVLVTAVIRRDSEGSQLAQQVGHRAKVAPVDFVDDSLPEPPHGHSAKVAPVDFVDDALPEHQHGHTVKVGVLEDSELSPTSTHIMPPMSPAAPPVVRRNSKDDATPAINIPGPPSKDDGDDVTPAITVPNAPSKDDVADPKPAINAPNAPSKDDVADPKPAITIPNAPSKDDVDDPKPAITIPNAPSIDDVADPKPAISIPNAPSKDDVDAPKPAISIPNPGFAGESEIKVLPKPGDRVTVLSDIKSLEGVSLPAGERGTVMEVDDDWHIQFEDIGALFSVSLKDIDKLKIVDVSPPAAGLKQRKDPPKVVPEEQGGDGDSEKVSPPAARLKQRKDPPKVVPKEQGGDGDTLTTAPTASGFFHSIAKAVQRGTGISMDGRLIFAILCAVLLVTPLGILICCRLRKRAGQGEDVGEESAVDSTAGDGKDGEPPLGGWWGQEYQAQQVQQVGTAGSCEATLPAAYQSQQQPQAYQPQQQPTAYPGYPQHGAGGVTVTRHEYAAPQSGYGQYGQ